MRNQNNGEPNYRLKARELFEALPWPGPDIEAWRRSAFRKIPFDRYLPYARGDTGESPPPEHSAAGLPPGFSGRIVFEEGVMKEAALSEGFGKTGAEPESFRRSSPGGDVGRLLLRSAEAAEDRVQAWQIAETTHGLSLRIPDRAVLPGPLLVEFREGGVDTCAAPHIAIILGESARADVVVRVRTGEGARTLVNFGASVETGRNGHLNFTLHQEIGSESRFFSTVRAFLDADSTLDFGEFHLGGLFVKTHSRVDCTAAGASLRMFGAYIADRGTHRDIGTVQGHRSVRGTSKALYKGIVAPGGRAVYQGLITVDEGAEKTDAYLSNRNILLGTGARADSIPKLVIGNNDVRCTHGSTTGRLDPLQLFYLASRGLPEKEAKKLLLAGFLGGTLEAVPGPYLPILEDGFSDVVSRLLDAGEA